MPLPTAVKRKADKARQQVADSNGTKAPAESLQRGDSEYLDISNQNQSVTNANVSRESSDTLGAQDNNAPGNPSPQTEGTLIPHALSDDAGTDAQQRSVDQATSDQLSRQRDSVDDAKGEQSGSSFIDPEDWKARYAALRAARDDRSDTLTQELSQLKAANGELQRQVQALTPEQTPADNRFELDDAARESLGEDQAKVFDQLSDSVEQRFKKQEAQQEAEKQRLHDRFLDDLSSIIPKWREINVDQAFLTWLGTTDETTGSQRKVMLDSFVDTHDANSAAALFRLFAQGGGHSQQTNGQQQRQVPDVQSSRAGTGADDMNMVEIWSQSEIADFFKAKNRLYQSGKLRGAKLEAVKAEEARIRKAMDENRVDMTA